MSHSSRRTPDLGGLYNELAQNEDPSRNPVILIPGILGSKRVDRSSGVIVWGTFGFGITNDPVFTDNLLYILLESLRER